MEDGIIIFRGNKVLIYNNEGQNVLDSYKARLFYCNPDDEN